jgi:outer membrane biogenesis lipoprotein LolB
VYHRIIVSIVAVMALSACASKHELAKCHGPLIAMNSDQWRPTALEMAELEKLCPEDR